MSKSQNISGASQLNIIAALSWTTEVDCDLLSYVKEKKGGKNNKITQRYYSVSSVIKKPRDSKWIWKGNI